MSEDLGGDVTSGGRGITVTIKYGKGYEQPWAVFHGYPDEVRRDIISYFGFDPEACAELTLHQIALNAKGAAQNTSQAAAILGATAIPSSSSDEGGGSAWAQAAAEPEGPTVDPIFSEIERAQSVDELREVWADNQAKFSDSEVMDAWKARGKALSAEAAA